MIAWCLVNGEKAVQCFVCGEVVIWSFVYVELLLRWCVACSIAC